jgi:hypothetical protein
MTRIPVNQNVERFQVWKKNGFEHLTHATVRDTWQGNRNITGEILLAQGLEPLASVHSKDARKLCATANFKYENGVQS